MKSHKLLYLLPVAFIAVSCLDETSKDQLDENEAYSNAKNIYINAVATLYNYIGGSVESEGLQGTCRGVYDYNTFTTDEAIIPIRGGDWYDGGLWENMYLHSWTKDDVSLYDTWKYLYKVVMLANNSLSVLDKYGDRLTGQQKTSYVAEVRAVRAMFYYYIMDMFGRIPLPTQSGTEQTGLEQQERSDVFRFIVDELQAAEPCLPTGQSNKEGDCYGRITASVAHFLLAKLALNAEIYTDDDWTDSSYPDGKNIFFEVDGKRLNAWETCVAYCDKLAEAGYRLEDDYAYNFSVHNENSNENIFVIPLDKNLYGNQFHYLFRSRHYNHGGALGTASENGPSATVATVRAYGYGTDDVDARFGINFYAGKVTVDGAEVLLDNGTPLEYMPLEIKLNLTDSPYMKTAGARMAKYEVDRAAYSDGCLPDNDIVLFRYADALLMKAEAKVRNGGDGTEELDAVRNRMSLPHREATLDNILTERLLELVWEGWRRQDLIRFRQFHKAYDQRPQLSGEGNAYTTVFPIPQKSIDLNKSLRQNKGY